VRVITDHNLGYSSSAALLDSLNIAKLAAAAIVALALYLGLRRPRSPLVLPGLLLAGIAIAHLAFALTGTTLIDARAAGWMFKTPVAVGLTPTWDIGDLRMFPWKLLPALSGELLAVMFVTAITMLLNTTGIEFVARRRPTCSAS
jgi:SulP family sulfate permease